jgi:antitoxin MazE
MKCLWEREIFGNSVHYSETKIAQHLSKNLVENNLWMLQHSYNFVERYFNDMKSKIISIGNSKGVIIPSSFMKDLGLTDSVEMEVVDNTLVIRPVSKVREGWENRIVQAAKGDSAKDRMPDFFKDEKLEDWKW